MSEVTREDVLRVAELANLALTGDEVPRMQHDLTAVLGHIAQLNQLDTAGVAPMAQVADALAGIADPAVRDPAASNPAALKPAPALAPHSDGATLRPDEVRPSVDRKAVMAQAPETDGRFFKVPKVIER
jgi:aspartyl-tRNA(Asn)/glutamyl-tRNA(Gln) amidotransferase subunit C